MLPDGWKQPLNPGPVHVAAAAWQSLSHCAAAAPEETNSLLRLRQVPGRPCTVCWWSWVQSNVQNSSVLEDSWFQSTPVSYAQRVRNEVLDPAGETEGFSSSIGAASAWQHSQTNICSSCRKAVTPAAFSYAQFLSDRLSSSGCRIFHNNVQA
jgi:hypothetical protein